MDQCAGGTNCSWVWSQVWVISTCSSEFSLCDVATMRWHLRQMELLVPSELVMCSKANLVVYGDAGRVRVATAGLFSRA